VGRTSRPRSSARSRSSRRSRRPRRPPSAPCAAPDITSSPSPAPEATLRGATPPPRGEPWKHQHRLSTRWLPPVPLPVPAAGASGRRRLKLPAIVLLLLWSIVPLAMTRLVLLPALQPAQPGRGTWAASRTTASSSRSRAGRAIGNTLLIVDRSGVITVCFGTPPRHVLFDQDFSPRRRRVLMIAPFFVMPTVSALIWKNMLMHPANGVISFLLTSVGLEPIDWFSSSRSLDIIMVAWQWLPFARAHPAHRPSRRSTGAQGGGRMDGAGRFSMFFFIIIPHLARAIRVVGDEIETLFLWRCSRRCFVTTRGRPGSPPPTLPFSSTATRCSSKTVGAASAEGPRHRAGQRRRCFPGPRHRKEHRGLTAMDKALRRKIIVTTAAWAVALAHLLPILWMFLTGFRRRCRGGATRTSSSTPR